MDRSNGPEVRISKEEVTTMIMKGLGEIPAIITRISFQDQTSHMEITAQTMGDRLSNAKTSRLIQTMETDFEMDLLITQTGTGDNLGTFLVHHRLKEETSHRITLTVNQEVINLITPRFVDLTIDPRPVLHPMNKNFRRTIIKHHLMWFASQQPMIPLTKDRTFGR